MSSYPVILCAALAAAQPEGLRDALGRPVTFGPPTAGATAAVHLGRTQLAFGQPLRFSLHIRNPSTRGPYANLEHGRETLIPRNLTVSLTDAAGKAVPFELVAFGARSALPGTHAQFRLDPKGGGRYWKPGSYRLSARVGFLPGDRPGTYREQIVSNTVVLTVAKPGETPPETEAEKQARGRVAELVRDLGSGQAATREAAEKRLRAESEPVVVLALAAALEKAEPDTRLRLILLLTARRGHLDRALMAGDDFEVADAMLWAGGLSDRDAEAAHKYLVQAETWPLALWHTLRMRYGPVAVPQGRPLTQAEKDKLIADLGAANPATRMQALRGVPADADADVRAAAAELLLDTVQYLPRMQRGHPVPVYPIAAEAREVLARLGPAAVPQIIAAARKRLAEADRHWTGMYYLLELLARQAPDETARHFFVELAASKNANVRGTAVHHLTAWGAKSVPFMRKLLADPKENPGLRSKAIGLLARFGDGETDAPVIATVLADGPPEVRSAAAQALGRLKYKPAVPQLTRVARDNKADWHARIHSVRAVIALAERKEWEGLLLYLADARQGGNVAGDALAMLAGHRVTGGLPVLLDALGDKDAWRREMADRGLRDLSGLRHGVGYNVGKPNPELWREHFRKNPVK